MDENNIKINDGLVKGWYGDIMGMEKKDIDNKEECNNEK